MPRFLFQPDPIDGYEFNPIPIDIHLGILKIPTEEILDDLEYPLTSFKVPLQQSLSMSTRDQLKPLTIPTAYDLNHYLMEE